MKKYLWLFALGLLFASPVMAADISGGGAGDMTKAVYDTNDDGTVGSADSATSATTADTANAGDSATAFFNAGTIEHERGGLEADVSGYSGLIKISGGVTSQAVSGTDYTNIGNTIEESELNLSDVTTGNFSTTKHGFVPKGTNVGNYLKDDGTWAAAGGGLTSDVIAYGTSATAGDYVDVYGYKDVWVQALTTADKPIYFTSDTAGTTGSDTTAGFYWRYSDGTDDGLQGSDLSITQYSPNTNFLYYGLNIGAQGIFTLELHGIGSANVAIITSAKTNTASVLMDGWQGVTIAGASLRYLYFNSDLQNYIVWGSK